MFDFYSTRILQAWIADIFEIKNLADARRDVHRTLPDVIAALEIE
jgi:hypothetical protein